MQPPLIAIVGAPNSGKSTLFNRLVGRRKALVHHAPGMTRDVNEESCDWLGRRVLLADTGGLFPAGEVPFAGEVMRSVLAAAAAADVLIFLVDGRAGLTPVDEQLARTFRSTGRPVVLAVNKLDVPGREEPAGEFHRLGFPTLVAISAEHGLGIDELEEAVAAQLPAAVGGEPEPQRGEVRVAIAGRPNVGKSSLLNALIGQERTLVSEAPGTTRDAIDCLLIREDRTYRIVDTAGIRRQGRVHEKPETLSVMAARRSVEKADVALIVMDATDAPTQQDLHVAGIAQESRRPFVVLLNKWDLVADAGQGEKTFQTVSGRLRFAPYAPVLKISARTGLRVRQVLAQVDEVHEQATRRFTTGRLNNWLRRAVEAHRPASSRGREFKLYYMAQKGTNPPAFIVFTNSASPPHFSYQRYLENSLRESFGLTRTPVILQYRQKPRRAGISSAPPQKPGRRAV